VLAARRAAGAAHRGPGATSTRSSGSPTGPPPSPRRCAAAWSA